MQVQMLGASYGYALTPLNGAYDRTNNNYLSGGSRTYSEAEKNDLMFKLSPSEFKVYLAEKAEHDKKVKKENIWDNITKGVELVSDTAKSFIEPAGSTGAVANVTHKRNYTPYIIGGIGVVALVIILKKKKRRK